MNNKSTRQIQNELSLWISELCHHDLNCETKLRLLIKNDKLLLNKINQEFKGIIEDPTNYITCFREIKKSICEFMEVNFLKVSKCEHCSSYNLLNPQILDCGSCYSCRNKFKINSKLTSIKQRNEIITRKCLYCSNKVFVKESLVCASCVR